MRTNDTLQDVRGALRRGPCFFVCAMIVACGLGVPAKPGAEVGGSAGTSSGTTMGATTSTTSGSTVAPTTTMSGSTGTSGTGVLSSSGGSGGGTTVATSEPGTETSNFVGVLDGGGPASCDPFVQDCPRGEKCSAYANDGGSSWNDAKCVPIMENPAQPGEPCFVVGNGVSGIDNCDLGAYCWDTDAENMGTCAEVCTGTPEAPVCSPGAVCVFIRIIPFGICIPACDPLKQDCDPGDVCIGSPSGDGFLCVLDASGEEGQVHDPCEFASSCDPGLICLNSTAAVECDPAWSGCCEPFCDLTAPNVCPGVGQVCNPYYEMGMAPPGSENVGYCAVPM